MTIWMHVPSPLLSIKNVNHWLLCFLSGMYIVNYTMLVCVCWLLQIIWWLYLDEPAGLQVSVLFDVLNQMWVIVSILDSLLSYQWSSWEFTISIICLFSSALYRQQIFVRTIHNSSLYYSHEHYLHRICHTFTFEFF